MGPAATYDRWFRPVGEIARSRGVFFSTLQPLWTQHCISTCFFHHLTLILSWCILLQYLILAKYLLVDSKSKLAGLETSSWWALRTLLTHQRCLAERSPSLQSLLRAVSSTVLSGFGTTEAVQAQEWGHILLPGEARVLAAAAQLEAGFAEHAFGHDNKARYA